MHGKLRGALGIAVPVLLCSAFAVGATALPASAKTWLDTALSASAVKAGKFGGAGLAAKSGTPTNGHPDITLSGTGVTWSLHGTVPSGVTLSGTTISYSGPAASSAAIVADATDGAGNAEALEIEAAFAAANSIQVSGTPVTVSLSALADADSSGTVKFSATDSKSTNAISFAESSLPTGLPSANPLTYVGATAVPDTYDGVVVTATDSDGAVLNGTFALTVEASAVAGYGNMLNRFGNGFDAYQQHQYAGAIVAGWPATQKDPATHFILGTGIHPSAYRFEYAPKGSPSGLCVSDPGGGWGSDPLRDGLILTDCNTGPWQEFIPQSNGTLKNVATGLYVNPAGTGAQLRGGTAPTPWGGSSYAWTDDNNLPA
jgi:hypothetical protein